MVIFLLATHSHVYAQSAVPGVDEKIRAHVEALRDRDAAVRYSAVEALVGIGPDAAPAVPALASALRDPDAGMRGAAAAAPALGDRLRDSNAGVREAAAAALRDIGPEAVPVLEEALKDPDAAVRWSAREALDAIGDRAIAPE